MTEVDNKTEAVAENVKGQNQTHLVKQEKINTLRCTYAWGTNYNKEKFEESRNIALPAELPNDLVYAYQLLTQADLVHMVAFNANTYGYMDDEEHAEMVVSTKKVLAKVLPTLNKYAKSEKEKEKEFTKYDEFTEMKEMYRRIKTEITEFE